jgi:hypothetical protein
MKNSVRGLGFHRYSGSVIVLVLFVAALAGGSPVLAHSPIVDASLSDWCVGAFSNTIPGGGRPGEDRAVKFVCGNCSVSVNLACEVNTDCPAGETCVNTTGAAAKRETAWWDDATDGAVNDLATVVMTEDAANLYIAAELWVDPDPESLPFGQIAIDFAPGGLGEWHDPKGVSKLPGRCSVSTDRACTGVIQNPANDTNMDGVGDRDCHFCAVSQEPVTPRPRTCGSGCNPLDPTDVCLMTETCVNMGAGGLKPFEGRYSNPRSDPEFLLLFDFSLWLISAGDAVLLMQPGTTIDPTSPWDPVTGCVPDFVGDNDWCDFPPAVNPGASGGSGGPPGSIEVAIPWSAFAGCTGCTPGFAPGVDFRFTMTVLRGTLSLDFTPDGAIEDVLTETVAGVTSLTPDSCSFPAKIGNTACEVSEKYGSADAYIPLAPPLAHEIAVGGRSGTLFMDKIGPSIELDWGTSCSAGDTAYAVYQGLVGTWYSHLPVAPGLCPNGGATSTTFVPGADNYYYLVVPTAGSSEGSYGDDSTPAERPVSTAACAPGQVLGNCY